MYPVVATATSFDFGASHAGGDGGSGGGRPPGDDDPLKAFKKRAFQQAKEKRLLREKKEEELRRRAAFQQVFGRSYDDHAGQPPKKRRKAVSAKRAPSPASTLSPSPRPSPRQDRAGYSSISSSTTSPFTRPTSTAASSSTPLGAAIRQIIFNDPSTGVVDLSIGGPPAGGGLHVPSSTPSVVAAPSQSSNIASVGLNVPTSAAVASGSSSVPPASASISQVSVSLTRIGSGNLQRSPGGTIVGTQLDLTNNQVENREEYFSTRGHPAWLSNWAVSGSGSGEFEWLAYRSFQATEPFFRANQNNRQKQSQRYGDPWPPVERGQATAKDYVPDLLHVSSLDLGLPLWTGGFDRMSRLFRTRAVFLYNQLQAELGATFTLSGPEFLHLYGSLTPLEVFQAARLRYGLGTLVPWRVVFDALGWTIDRGVYPPTFTARRNGSWQRSLPRSVHNFKKQARDLDDAERRVHLELREIAIRQGDVVPSTPSSSFVVTSSAAPPAAGAGTSGTSRPSSSGSNRPRVRNAGGPRVPPADLIPLGRVPQAVHQAQVRSARSSAAPLVDISGSPPRRTSQSAPPSTTPAPSVPAAAPVVSVAPSVAVSVAVTTVAVSSAVSVASSSVASSGIISLGGPPVVVSALSGVVVSASAVTQPVSTSASSSGSSAVVVSGGIAVAGVRHPLQRYLPGPGRHPFRQRLLAAQPGPPPGPQQIGGPAPNLNFVGNAALARLGLPRVNIVDWGGGVTTLGLIGQGEVRFLPLDPAAPAFFDLVEAYAALQAP